MRRVGFMEFQYLPVSIYYILSTLPDWSLRSSCVTWLILSTPYAALEIRKISRLLPQLHGPVGLAVVPPDWPGRPPGSCEDESRLATVVCLSLFVALSNIPEPFSALDCGSNSFRHDIQFTVVSQDIHHISHHYSINYHHPSSARRFFHGTLRRLSGWQKPRHHL